MQLANAMAGFWRGLLPDQIDSLADWAAKHRRLSKEASKEYGRWSNDRVPFAQEPMENLSVSSPVEVTVLMYGAQLTKTETGNNLIGYVLHQGLGPIMVIQQTSAMAIRFSKQRLRPMIRDTPCLFEKIGDPSKRNGKNSLLHLETEGVQLIVANAEAAGNLRSMPIRFIFGDEIDAYPDDVEGEGDPCKLAEARTRTYASRRKVLWASTPLNEGSSKIQKRYKAGDQRQYHVPCPECGFKQVLIWDNLKFDRDKENGELIRGSVRYACCECGALISEWQKTEMLAKGEWIPQRPTADPSIRSYHLNSLYSPVGWFGWERIVKEFLEAQGDQEALKTWTNTVLAETWKQIGEVPDYQRLYNRRETYSLGTAPKGVVFLTMGVDVQKDRLEYEVVGWGPRHESWSIECGVFSCDPTQDDWHAFFDELRLREWPSEENMTLRIRKSAFDMGYQNNHVYKYTRHRSDTFAIQGKDSHPSIVGPERRVDVNTRRGAKLRGGAIVRYVGTDLCKGELYSFLRNEKPVEGQLPVGWCHFPQHDVEYFKQLTAEHLVPVKNSKGKKVKKWDKLRERNEMLDCRIYARAAASVVGLDRWKPERWEKERLAVLNSKRSKGKRKKKQKGYLEGGESPWLGH